MANPNFLKEKFSPDEWNSAELSARRIKKSKSKKLRNVLVDRHGEEWKNQEEISDAELKIQNLLDRFSDVIKEKDHQKKWSGLDILKRYLYRIAVISPNNEIFHVSSSERINQIVAAKRNEKGERVDEKGKQYKLSYFDKLIIRTYEEGKGIGRVPAEEQKQEIEKIINDQKQSLDYWLDYLSSDDAKYPDWLKYYALKNIINMGRYDKKEKVFAQRGTGSLSPFPELVRDALSFVLDAYEKKYHPECVKIQKEIKSLEEKINQIYKQIKKTSQKDEKEKLKIEVINIRLEIQALQSQKKEKQNNLFAQLKEDFSPDKEKSFTEDFLPALGKEDFPKLYAWGIENFAPMNEKLWQITTGQWITFPKGSDPIEYIPKEHKEFNKTLLSSLSTYATGWCIRGEATARRYLQENDLIVYYSNDIESKPNIPRVVIVKNNEGISEVRGVAPEENLDPYINEEVKKKLDKFGEEGSRFEKAQADMMRLTEIDEKINSGLFDTQDNKEKLRQDLKFFYEIDSNIQGFGYQPDPRIQRIRNSRNTQEDARLVFEKTTVIENKVHGDITLDKEDLIYLYEMREPIKFGNLPDARINKIKSERNPQEDLLTIFSKEQIARNLSEISAQTKIYIGPLLNYDQEGKTIPLFDFLHNIEHIYTSFPERKISHWQLEIGGKDTERLEKNLRVVNVNVPSYTEDMLHNPDFTTLPNPEQIDLVRLQVKDLFGYEENHTTAEIMGTVDDKDDNDNPAPFTKGKMTELGLELCPAEVGPYQRLKDLDQPLNTWYRIAMKPITDRGGCPDVFRLERDDRGLWLHSSRANPTSRWYPGYEFVFRPRKVSHES